MQLDDIHTIFRTSTSDEWLYVPCHSGSGSSYVNDRTSYNEGSGGDWWMEHKSHSYRLTYRKDVALTIAYGMDVEEDASPPRLDDHFLSMINGQDQKASLDRVDVFWNGALIERYHYYTISPARAWVPYIEANYSGPDAEPTYSVSGTAVKLLELLRVMETGSVPTGHRSIRESLEHIGATILSDERQLF